MKRLVVKHRLSAIDKLKKVASRIVFEEDIKTKQPRLSEVEFKKMATEVSKTFPDDYIARSQVSF